MEFSWLWAAFSAWLAYRRVTWTIHINTKSESKPFWGLGMQLSGSVFGFNPVYWKQQKAALTDHSIQCPSSSEVPCWVLSHALLSLSRFLMCREICSDRKFMSSPSQWFPYLEGIFDIIKYLHGKISQPFGVCFSKINEITSLIHFFPSYYHPVYLIFTSHQLAFFGCSHHKMTLSWKIIIQQEICSKSYMEPTMSAMQRTSTFCFENKKK